MEQMRTTQAARYIGVHRSTLNRLNATGVLTADGVTGSNRPYWLKETLDRYRLGMSKVGSYAYISSPILPELSVAIRPKQLVLGHSASAIPLVGSNRAACYAALLTHLAAIQPAAMLLPAGNDGHHLHRTTVEMCSAIGTAVIHLPQ